MAKFQDTLDKINDRAETIMYLINNPEPNSEWVQGILEEIDSLTYYAKDFTNKFGNLPDEYTLSLKLQEYYGENSDGTYEDFTIPS